MNAPAPQTTSSLAITSLIGGILGWTLVPLLGSILAIITGHLARKEIRGNPALSGDGLAVAGLVLGYAMVGLSIVGILFVLAVVLFFGGLAVLGSH